MSKRMLVCALRISNWCARHFLFLDIISKQNAVAVSFWDTTTAFLHHTYLCLHCIYDSAAATASAIHVPCCDEAGTPPSPLPTHCRIALPHHRHSRALPYCNGHASYTPVRDISYREAPAPVAYEWCWTTTQRALSDTCRRQRESAHYTVYGLLSNM